MMMTTTHACKHYLLVQPLHTGIFPGKQKFRLEKNKRLMVLARNKTVWLTGANNHAWLDGTYVLLEKKKSNFIGKT